MLIKQELERVIDLESGARVLPLGAHLYSQGDQCSTAFVVLSGWIALSTLLDDGSCQIVDFALPGAVLGFATTADTLMYHSARCLSLTRVCAIPQQRLDAVIEANPRLALLLYRDAAANEARAHDHLTNLGLRGSRERIAHLLLEFYVRLRHRLPHVPGEIIDLPLSQGNLGEALGLTSVHVCRMLQILREQKIIRLANHKLEIIDPSALIAAAGVQLDPASEPPATQGRASIARCQAEGTSQSGTLPAGWMPLPIVPPARPGRPSSAAFHRLVDAKAA